MYVVVLWNFIRKSLSHRYAYTLMHKTRCLNEIIANIVVFHAVYLHSEFNFETIPRMIKVFFVIFSRTWVGDDIHSDDVIFFALKQNKNVLRLLIFMKWNQWHTFPFSRIRNYWNSRRTFHIIRVYTSMTIHPNMTRSVMSIAKHFILFGLVFS